MFQIRGFWLPDGETHLIPFLEDGPQFADGPTYQLHKLLACLPHVKNFRHAVDIGAHCGLWSRPLAAMFSRLSAFEPVKAHIDCWYANVPDGDLIRLYDVALGAESKSEVFLHTGASSSGDTYVQAEGEHAAKMHTLDFFGLTDIDFIKIDCEGYENFILAGGEKTIREQKPLIIIEQKPGKGAQFGIHDTAAIARLQTWGYEIKASISGDYIMKWR